MRSTLLSIFEYKRYNIIPEKIVSFPLRSLSILIVIQMYIEKIYIADNFYTNGY